MKTPNKNTETKSLVEQVNDAQDAYAAANAAVWRAQDANDWDALPELRSKAEKLGIEFMRLRSLTS